MDNAEIIEAIRKISEYCKKITCSECDFCDKATGECAIAKSFSYIGEDYNILLPPSEWNLKELLINE